MAKIGKLGKLNLKWGQVMNVLLILFVVLGLYYLVYHTNLFGMRMYEGLHNVEDNTDDAEKSDAEKSDAEKSDGDKSDADKSDAEKNGSKVTKKVSAPNSSKKIKKDMTLDELTNAVKDAETKKSEKEAFGNMLEDMAPYASNPMQPADMPNWFMDNTKFSHTCCPSTYSSSSGCACLSPQQMSYLNQRGGNRTSASLY